MSLSLAGRLPVRTQWASTLPAAIEASSQSPTAESFARGLTKSMPMSPKARLVWVPNAPDAFQEDTYDEEYRPYDRGSGSRQNLMCCFFCLCCLAIIGLPLYLTYSYCQNGVSAPANQALPILEQLGADWSVGWWSMPEKQSTTRLLELQKKLYMLETRQLASTDMVFGTALGADAARMLYNESRVEGVWELLPEKLKGVFWVRGEGTSQLITFQYSRWFPQQRLLVVPTAPVTAAWTDGSGATTGGVHKGFVYQPTKAQREAADLIVDSAAVSFHFGACPPGAKYCKQPAGAVPTPQENMTYATMQLHPAGSLKALFDYGEDFDETKLRYLPFAHGLFRGSLSIQELPASVKPGALWAQSDVWSFGQCPSMETGHTLLMKIVDASGEPLQPYWDQYMQSKGQDPVYLWAGFPSEEVRLAASRRFEARAMMG